MHAKVHLPLTPEQVWSAAQDLESTPEWLVLLEGWRGPVPDQLGIGTKATGVLTAKGFRNRTVFECTVYDEPRLLELRGHGIAGARYALDVKIEETATGTHVDIAINLGGPPLFGPIGKIVAMALRSDIEQSAANFRDRYGII
ncbi:SRPBCC family protein [Smaragdicoccus niigatensis]